MKYTKHFYDFEKALGLTNDQVARLKTSIAKAYHSLPDKDFSIDEISAMVAPDITTPEEAYYVAQRVIIDVMSASAQSLRAGK